MEKEIVKKTETGVSFEQMKSMAEMFIKSGFFPREINTPEKAITIMLTGRDLGLSFVESLRSITVVNGRPCMSAQLLLGLCQRTGLVEKAHFEVETAEEAVFILQRKGNEPYRSVFTLKDAEGLGLSRRDNWIKQPKTMLRWRAISQACRIVFPDAISGIYTPEEIADDVILTKPVEGAEPEISEVIIHDEIKAEPQSVKDQKPLEGDDLPDDQLANWEMPFGQYKGMRLIDIIGEETPQGKKKGLEYLRWVVREAKDRKKARIVERFLALLEEGGML